MHFFSFKPKKDVAQLLPCIDVDQLKALRMVLMGLTQGGFIMKTLLTITLAAALCTVGFSQASFAGQQRRSGPDI